MEKNEAVRVNDGGGLFDSFGLIDSLIVDCNSLPKALFEGKYVAFCNLVVQMVQKLSALREGISNEQAEYKKQIEDVQRLNDELSAEIHGVPVDTDRLGGK